jgi:hypothetical protein
VSHLSDALLLDEAKLLRDALVHDMQLLGAPATEPLFCVNSSPVLVFSSDCTRGATSLVFRRLASGKSLESWLQSHGLGPFECLTVLESTLFAGLTAHETFPAVINLAVSLPRGYATYGTLYGDFGKHFSRLKILTLIGPAVRIDRSLRSLPDSLEHLRLEIRFKAPGIPHSDNTAHGNLHKWNFIPALRKGLRVGVRGTNPRLTLLTGPEEPMGLSLAVHIAQETGVCLNREIDTSSVRRARRWV